MKQTIYGFLVVMLMAHSVYSQTGSINNTLGSGGSFLIKDGSTTFFSLSQSTGILSLGKSLLIPVTTSASIGTIFKGSDRFIHDYAAAGTDGYNAFIGVNAGNFSMSGSGTESSRNTAVGHSALQSLTTGANNVALGVDALRFVTSGVGNSAVGYQALSSSATAWYNSAFGFQALTSNSTGGINSAFGYQALFSNTIGWQNTAIGSEALRNNTSGAYNTAAGVDALKGNTVGLYNTAAGYRALFSAAEATGNSAFGFSSLYSLTTGSSNAAFGYNSMRYATSGGNNAAFGADALTGTTTGTGNTAVGTGALNGNETGSDNTAVGYLALLSQSGSQNIAIGGRAGQDLSSGSNNIILGYNAQASSATISNEITLGNSAVTSLRCNVASISSLSDKRDKRNINDLSLGLEFLMTIKPRMFNWDKREWYADNNPTGTKMNKTPTAGFIAQELDEAQMNANAEWLHLVLKSNPERMEATPGNLLPIIVKAIQDVHRRSQEKDDQIVRLQRSILRLETMVEKLLAEQQRSGTPHSTTIAGSQQ